MKLKFDANLEYQADAVNSVVDLFEGQPLGKSDFEINWGVMEDQLPMEEFTSELGVGNKLLLGEDILLKNIRNIQEKNEINLSEKVGLCNGQGLNFSVEMETGTGKTYVYLRTIFELNRKYGFKKFIIVVPGVAIREGTLKNLEITKEHFLGIFNNMPYDYYVYDSKKVSKLRQFSTGNQLQILVINIDAFRKIAIDESDTKGNVIHRENDKLSGRKPIEFIQATNPIVIIDEPQSVDNTEKSKEAIATLKPLFILRYSATHKNPYNMVYKLDPIRAYDMKLVKRIEVDSVIGESNLSLNEAFIRLISVDNKNGIKAKITILDYKSTGVKENKITVKNGDNLANKSGRSDYMQGYIVSEISCEPGNEYIKFNSGRVVSLGQSQGGMTDEVMKVQVRKTIEEHLDKELKLKGMGIKVLSLFFIDRVANYRYYDEQGNPQKGKIALWFEEEYKELIKKEKYKELIPFPIDKIHDGYFAQDKKGKFKDSREGKETQDDEDVYNKIMKNKEQLLSLDEPLKFIFSHSALREGWDNPNVFQICTLNETKSEIKKRQEIGRGMRLPVNKDGERVFDESINKLTVIANESYEDFAKKLQTEIEEDFGIKFGRVEKIAFAKLKEVVGEQEKPVGADKSEKIWKELKQKGYIDEKGDIQPAFDPKKEDFELRISPEFEELKPAITEVLESYVFENRIVNKNKRKTLKLNKQVYLDPEFKNLWDKINQKTTFSVEYNTEVLIQNTSKAIKEMEGIEPLKIKTRKAGVEIDKSGVSTTLLKDGGEVVVNLNYVLPDILAFLQKETELTRNTLYRILRESGRLKDFSVNPQKFMGMTSDLIRKTLNEMIIDGIKYEKIAGEEYEMRLFEQEEVIRYLNNLLEVDHSVYDAIEYQSEIERKFAKELDKREDIKLFVKLPIWFKIDTPIGSYNPDWAIVKQNDETLYLVRETKSTKDFEKLHNSEAYKIKCGKKHFDTLGVDFAVVVEAKEI